MRKILVIGGGIGGLTVAIALQQRGLEAHVYESADRLRAVGAGIWVPANAMQVLDRLGLAEAVTREGLPLKAIELWDKDEGPLTRLDLLEIKATCGQTIVSIHRATLQHLLARAVEPDTLHLGKKCIGFRQDGDHVVAGFADGTEVEAEVLIGADGIHSVIRNTLFPEVKLRYSGQTCYRGIARMKVSDVMAATCREVWGGRHRFGFSPVTEQQVYWFAPMVAPPGGTEPVQPEAYAGFPAPIPEMIALTPVNEIIRTDLYDFPPMGQWHRGRVVLLGDAAHAMTPNLGQGGGQAIEDAFVLAHQMSTPSSLAAALQGYEHVRQSKVRRMVDTAWRLGQLAHLRNRPMCTLRNMAMRHMPGALQRKQSQWLYRLDY